MAQLYLVPKDRLLSGFEGASQGSHFGCRQVPREGTDLRDRSHRRCTILFRVPSAELPHGCSDRNGDFLRSQDASRRCRGGSPACPLVAICEDQLLNALQAAINRYRLQTTSQSSSVGRFP